MIHSKYRFFQIKIKQYNGIDNGKQEVNPNCTIMRLIDISDKIMFHMAIAEKKMQALFNATVSHDMRDPTNSIHCQNIQQKELNKQLYQLI